ncbi:hypothetical protein J8273_8540 [Carpediemonas membranifera]|uniref:Uncharacterized protein n=1 Tax=Carpediemonas membranifera TaxID=201153 RepID=A0A8J6DZ24_9EUKA|nr:hypothetical protein J8273_8540 [Carpediemonas membranifera]|eukprot:KAG9389861.1 hypothetical protein J8273_8540 [Carpediemonas membranifera]
MTFRDVVYSSCEFITQYAPVPMTPLYVVCCICLIIYYPAWFLAAKPVRQKTYYRRINLIVGIFCFECFLTTGLLPSYIIEAIGYVMCKFNISAGCSFGESIPLTAYFVFGTIGIYIIPTITFYLFIGYSLTTSIFLTRVMAAKSLQTGAVLSRKRFLVTPLWEHAAVWSTTILLTLVRFGSIVLMAAFIGSTSTVGRVADIAQIGEPLSRNLFILAIVVVQWLIFLYVVSSLFAASRGKSKKHTNYSFLIASFVFPFTVYALLVFVALGINFAAAVAEIVVSIQEGGARSFEDIRMDNLAVYLLYASTQGMYIICKAVIVLQMSFITLSHAFLLAKSRVSAVKCAMKARTTSYEMNPLSRPEIKW